MFSSLSEREQQILALISEEPGMPVAEIAEQLGVSQVTVRSQLNALAEKGYLLRTHGGGVPAFHPSILERQQSNRETKEALARFAASRVSDGETIMIEAGTTTALIARFLIGRRDLKVVTNNMLVLPYARINPGLTLSLIGGEFRAPTESVVGPVALLALSRFHVETAFVGTDGFSLEHGFTTHLVEGAEIVRAMATRAQRTVVVADSTKFGRTGFAHVLALNEVSELITDASLPPEAVTHLREAGVTVTIVNERK
ncbi:MAG: DeoR/GlpR family DNA-binding transcription regulator [Alkalispirochaetaceae bacterium]